MWIVGHICGHIANPMYFSSDDLVKDYYRDWYVHSSSQMSMDKLSGTSRFGGTPVQDACIPAVVSRNTPEDPRPEKYACFLTPRRIFDLEMTQARPIIFSHHE